MRLPLRSWTSTLSSLGFKWCDRKPSKQKRQQRQSDRLAVEALETRQLLAVGAVGDEFLVNSYTTNTQKLSEDSGRAVAYQTSGQFVSSWTSNAQDGSNYGVYGQRFDDDGDLLGSEFLANTTTSNAQKQSTISTDASGNYVIAWEGSGQDGDQTGIYAQRYSASGTALGSEFQVSVTTTGAQELPEVAHLSDGAFVVAWSGKGSGDVSGVYVRHYNTSGVAQTSEVLVNTHTSNEQSHPSIAPLAAGGFVVTWESHGGQDGESSGVYAQRFDSSAAKVGSEIIVNTTTANFQQRPAVASAPDGSFAIVWESNAGSAGWEIRGQRYNSSGQTVGSEFAINQYTADTQEKPAIAFGPGGGFLVVWNGKGSEDSAGIYAREYDSSGQAVGDQFLVNTYTTNAQTAPSVAGNSDGYVITWSGNGQLDTSAEGVYGRIFVRPNTAPTTSGIADLSVSEDASATSINLHNAFADAEQADSLLTYTITANTNPGLFSSTPISAGTLTLNYAANASGAADITVRATDPLGLYVQTTFHVTVAAVNDQPTTTGIANVSVDEDSANVSRDLWGSFADIEDADNQLTYTVHSNSNAQLFTAVTIVAATGLVVLDFAPNKNGQGQITVRATDTGGLYRDTTFDVEVVAVNDSPTTSGFFDVISDEDGGTTSVGVAGGFFDIEDDAQLVYTVANNTNPGLFSSTPINGETGVLTLNYAADAYGEADLTLRATDPGGLFVESTFHVTLNPVNDAPSFQVGADQSVAMNVGQQTVSGFATEINAGAANESSQIVSFLVNSNHLALFAQQPAIAADGTLTYTPVAGATGSAFVTVQIRDDGGTDFGGEFISPIQTFLITVVNQAPTIGQLLDGPDTVINGSELQLQASGVTDDGAVQTIAFYRDSNSDNVLTPATDQLLGTDSDGANGWGITVSTAGFGEGAKRYFAVATDDQAATSAPVTTVGTIGVASVLDNSNPGYAETGTDWTDGPSSGLHGNSRQHSAGVGDNSAQWNFTGLAPGLYQVQVTWSAGSDRATNAPYHVTDGASTLGIAPIDQTVAPNDFSDGTTWWESVGYYQTTNGTLSVQLSDDANGVVSVDGVRLLAVAPLVLYWDPDSDAANNLIITGAGLGGSGNWTAGSGNVWFNPLTGQDVAWVNGAQAVFAGTGGTVTLSGAVSTTKVTSSAGTVTLQSGTINLPSFTGTTVEVVSGTLSIGSTLAGDGGFTKSGSGTLIVSGNNTFTGGVTIDGSGILQLGSANALNASAPNSVTFATGSSGVLRLAGNSVTVAGLRTVDATSTAAVENGSVTVTTLTVSQAADTSGTFAGILRNGAGSQDLALTKAGDGTFVLSGPNTFTGLTTAAGGVLQFAGPTTAPAVSSILINGGDISVDDGVRLTSRTGNIQFSSNNQIKPTGSTGAMGFAAGNAFYTITVDAGVTGTISAAITGITTGNSIKRLGAGNLILAGQNVLVTDVNANLTAGVTVDGGGQLDITGLVKAASSLQSNRSNGTSTVGQNSSGNVLVVDGAGRIIAGRLDVGGGAFGNNSVIIASPGTRTTPSQWMIGNGAQLNLGVSSSNNSVEVSDGAYVFQSNGGGTNAWTIGTNAGANSNSLTVTGAGSTVDRTAAAGSVITVGAAGNSNSLIVSDGGLVLPRRLVIGNGPSVGNGSNNYALVTGTGSSISIPNDSNGVFQVGSGVGSSGNSLTVADGASVNLAGANATRAFSIGSANSADDNYVRITGIGSSAVITNLGGPLTIGGLNTGTVVDTTAQGNHLDVFAGASLTATHLQLLGVDSALNLGDGTGVSTAIVGNATFNANPTIINLTSASSQLNIDGGRLIVGVGIPLITGAGSVQLDGGAYINTAGFNTSIASAIGGSGSLTKEGAGTLTVSGTNTYSGQTIVQAGEFNVTGALTDSDVTVSGGSLTGNGSVGGSVAIANGAFLAPGAAGTAILSTGDLTLASGARYVAQVNGDTAGSQHDRTNVTGTVSLDGAQLVVSGTRVANDGSVLVLLKNDGGDAISGTFANLAEGAAVAVNGVVYHITYTYNTETGQLGSGNDIALIDSAAQSGLGLNLSASLVDENGTVTLTGAFNDPGSTSAHTVTIAWGDGSADTVVNLGAGVFEFSGASHQYADNLSGNANYAIHVSVVDDNSATMSADTQITVFNVAPTATIGTGGTAQTNTPVTVSLTATDTSTIDAASLHYFFSTSQSARDASTYATSGTESEEDFSFTSGGIHIVYGRVLDKDGGYADYQTSVAVTSPPQLLYWDANGATPGLGGSGTWDATSANWTTSAQGEIATIGWVHDADAIFQGTAGTVTVVGSPIVRSAQFNTTDFVIQSAALEVSFEGLTVTVGSGLSATIDTLIAGDAGLTKIGDGTLVLSGNNTYSGSTTIADGTLAVSAGAAIPNLSSVSITDPSATLSLLVDKTIGSLTGTGHVDLGTHVLTVGANHSNSTYAGVISGSGQLAKSGTGTLTLAGSNTYTGGTTVSGGTLSVSALSDTVGQSSALGHSGAITVFNSTFHYTGSGAVSTSRWSTGAVNGTTVIDVSQSSGSLTLTSSYTTSQNLTKVGEGTLILGGENQVGFRSAAVQAGTLALAMKNSNPNTYAAVGWITDVKPGATLQLRKHADGNFYDGQIRATPGDANRQVHMSGGTLDLNGDEVNRIPVVDGTGTITNSAAGTTAVLNAFLNFNKTFSGTIQDGAGQVSVVAGASAHNGFSTTGVVWTLDGENSYSGTTTVSGNGTLKLGAADAVPEMSVIQIGVLNQGYGVLDLNGHDVSVGGLFTDAAGGANNVRYDEVTNSAGTLATLTIDNTAGYTFDGVFAGNLAVAKHGSGKLTVAGTNTNSGDVAVYDGNLKILGTFSVIPYIVEGFGDPQITGADDPYYSVVAVSLAHGEAGWTSVGNPDLHTAPGNPDVLATTWQEAAVRALSGTIEVQGGNNSNSPFAFNSSNVTIVTSSTTSGFTKTFAVGTLGDIKSWVQYNNGAGFDLAPNGGTLASWDTKVIVMEDQFGLGFSDNDYDDNYWVLTVQESNLPFATPGCWTCTAQAFIDGIGSAMSGLASSISASGVRLSDGIVSLDTGTLSSGGFGLPFGQGNTWTNQPLVSSGNTGVGMAVAQTPKLLQVSGTTIVAAFGANTYWFDLVSGNYVPRFFGQQTLTPDTGNKEFVLTDTTGTAITFNDFDTSLPMARWGTFKKMADAAGNLTTVTSYTSDGKIGEVQRSATQGSDTITESFLYTYVTSGANSGLQSSVTLRAKVNSGSWSTIRVEEYTYYDGSYSHGNVADLKLSVVKDGSGNTIDTTYFRYYTDATGGGYQHGLKYIFRTESYGRLANAFANPFTATDTQVAPYADGYLEYDSSHRVTTLVSQGQGCSSCTGGLGTYTYSYTTSSNSDGYNSWKYKTVETLPDGNQNIVYMNYAGETMLSIFKDTTTNDQWLTFYKYDSAGRQILMANPSAVTGFSESYADLLNDVSGNYQYLADSAGLVTVTDFYASTTATATTAGGAAGYYQDTKLKRGETGTAILQDTTDYFSRTGGGATIYPVADTIVYRNDDGTGAETTSYAYTWTTGTTHMESMTVSLPVVSSSQNGPGAADTTTYVFDQYGRTSWTKDGDGIINYTSYDQATSAAVKKIVDVDTTQTSDFSGLPSGWSTPSGGGLHLITTYEVDSLGRDTKVTDPNGNIIYVVYNDTNHETRTYRGWNSGTNTTTGPTIVTRQDRPGSYYETLTMSATPAVSSGRPTGTEAVSGLQTLSRSYTNSAGQLVKTDDYFDFTGLTYSTAANIGTEGTNFYRSEYAYQQRGWLNRLEDFTGTITRTVHDSLGRIVSEWVGTDDIPTTGSWSPTNNTGANMVQIAGYEYDNGGVGDSTLTKTTQKPGGGADDRGTAVYYDWRNRLVATKGGVQATEGTATQRPTYYTVLDNLGEATANLQFDGDNVTIVDANSDGVPDQPSSSLLRAKTTSDFDDQGRVYRASVYSVDQSSGAVSTYALRTDQFFDHRGNLVKMAAPGGLVQKMQYDGAGREAKSLVTDGGGDSGWSDAHSVSGDAVLEQSENQYDDNGNVILTIHRARFHDETGTGELGTASSGVLARVGYAAMYYDAVNRQTAQVDVGTNGGSAYTRPSSVPSRSDVVLVTSYQFNASGWVSSVTDPRAIETRTEYDRLGRTVQTIQAYVNGTPSANDDLTTEYTYDGMGHVLTLTAVLPGSTHQTTEYIYGVTTIGGSDVNSNDLLRLVKYPNKTTGDPSTSSADQESFAYNALGQTRQKTDRNGSVDAYSFDVLGRLTADAVTTLASGVDGAVRRIATNYDTAGRVFQITSYDAASAGNVVNQVERHYNGLSQLTAEYQEHSGAVNTSTTEAVDYVFSEMASGANHSRLKEIIYPNGRKVRSEYSSGLDDTISRLSFLADDSSGSVGTHLEELSYLGLGTVVARAHPQPDIDLTYVKQGSESNGDAGDKYTGLDRFGRIVDQRWLDTGSGNAVDRFGYGYDRDSNRLYRENLVDAAFSELYHENGSSNGYDLLNRLTAFARGTLNSGKDTISSPAHSQEWDLDALGNWDSLTTDGGTPEDRDHNAQNQVTDVGSNSLTFDNNGNTMTDEQGNDLIYDAWNRLVEVQDSGSTTIAEYAHDGLNRRITEDFGTPRALFYSANWQVVEERESGVAVVQNVWSPVYIDALILRDRDADSTSGNGLEERLYALHDANFNVTALVDVSGAIVERYIYDPYGAVTILDDDFSADGDNTSDVGWNYLHQGGRYDLATQLYHFRNRDLNPMLGRWLQTDPIGYADSQNLYSYLLEGPPNLTDAYGSEIEGQAVKDFKFETTGAKKTQKQTIDMEYGKPQTYYVQEYGPTANFSGKFSLSVPQGDQCNWQYTFIIRQEDPTAKPVQPGVPFKRKEAVTSGVLIPGAKFDDVVSTDKQPFRFETGKAGKAGKEYKLHYIILVKQVDLTNNQTVQLSDVETVARAGAAPYKKGAVYILKDYTFDVTAYKNKKQGDNK